MTPLERRMEQDRATRDAALRLFKNDITVIKGEMQARSIGTRLADRLSEGAMDLMDDALDYAEDNKGKVGAGITAALLLVARGPILRALGLSGNDGSEEPEDTE